MKNKRRLWILFLSAACAALCISLAACGGRTEGSQSAPGSDTQSSDTVSDSGSLSDSTSDSTSENPRPPSGNVTDYMLDEERKFTGTLKEGEPEGEGKLEWVQTNCVYTGEFKNGVYEGKGTFEWRNTGDKLEGIFSNGAPVNGKYTYANTMSYAGEFNEKWKFEGEGVFDWNMYAANGSVKEYGWLYEGEFKNGTPVGCRGKITFIRHGSDAGVYWFEGEMSGFPEVKKGQQGRGRIVYPDGSFYEGDVYYSSKGEWLRCGEGMQNFFNTTFTGASAGGSAEDKIYCYQGSFDARNYSWMYGNGVMYFSDVSGRPTGYIKGTWNGLIRVGEYTGNWTEDMLAERWKNTEELSYHDAYLTLFNAYMEQWKDTDMTGKLLMLGDSQFSKECFPQAVELLSDEFDAVDIAIGGTTSAWWNDMLDQVVLGEPEYILIHVGGNDICVGNSRETAIRDTKALIDALKVKYPRSKIFYVSLIVGTFVYEQNFDEKFIAINDAMKEYAAESGKFEYIDVVSLFYSADQVSDIYDERFGYLKTEYFADGMHLKKTAYDLWGEAIKSELLKLLQNK